MHSDKLSPFAQKPSGKLVFLFLSSPFFSFLRSSILLSLLCSYSLTNIFSFSFFLFRDGALVEIESRELVPGDMIVLRLGDIVPADARLLGNKKSILLLFFFIFYHFIPLFYLLNLN